jgi:peptide deformylase
MAKLLEIYKYPNNILRSVAQDVQSITPEIREKAEDMVHTMLESKGAGLAGPQVGYSWRIVAVNLSAALGPQGSPIIMINPKITTASSKTEIGREGCLSLPKEFYQVERHSAISVQYRDLDGKVKSMMANGYLARIIQHELDHLDGILIIDKKVN